MGRFLQGFWLHLRDRSRHQAQNEFVRDDEKNIQKSLSGVIAIEFPKQEVSCRIASVTETVCLFEEPRWNRVYSRPTLTY